MIGVFDSGAGGLYCACLLHRRLPRADIAFYADRENAPYGTKTEDALRALVTEDIRKLKSAGAEEIFAACGTAGSVMLRCPDTDVFRNVRNVILPAAMEAVRRTGNGKIGVIATERTAASRIYRERVRALCPSCDVMEVPAQALVPLAETPPCQRDPALVKEETARLSDAFRDFMPDTLILGCTHFSRLKRDLACAFPGVRLVGCAEEGVKSFVASLPPDALQGEGKLLIL